MTRTRSKPRAPLSRDRIVRAAMDLADEQGIEALSMRKLAGALGVEAMSLYNHVRNKDALLDAMVEVVASAFTLPRVGAPWEEEMRRRALGAHDVLMRHPWATQLLVSRANTGPNMLAYVDATLGCLHEAGMPWERVDRIWNAVDSYVYGFTLQALNFPFEEGEYADVAREHAPTVPADVFPYLAALTTEVAEGRHLVSQQLAFGLDRLLEGLARDGG